MIPIERIYETVQGEGYWTGTPCTLVRTWGCPVGCWFCDTGYANGGTPKSPKAQLSTAEIVEQCTARHVVITGGEPVIIPQLPELVNALREAGKTTQIETSGFKWVDVDGWVTLSPKNHVASKADHKWWDRADEVKIVLAEEGDAAKYDLLLRHHEPENLFWQPEWGTRAAIQDCIAAANTYGGRVSFQSHKYAGLE